MRNVTTDGSMAIYRSTNSELDSDLGRDERRMRVGENCRTTTLRVTTVFDVCKHFSHGSTLNCDSGANLDFGADQYTNNPPTAPLA
ncbi:hypothetical protein EVAR_94605_1 [Eumeta japonica]|uniref:Uncharacterized protein n=1 Tax=Eumeta variegata TaxID=151549 RepID=A0A4C1UTK8_EUMVA|nr:hypothetical protein EVAR_94605_1 [Eumeta japonica]